MAGGQARCFKVDRKTCSKSLEKYFQQLARVADRIPDALVYLNLEGAFVRGREIDARFNLRFCRFAEYGVNGAGSNLSSAADITAQNVRVGVSVEGRKFWRLIPEDGNFGKLRKDFVIGHEVLRGLRSEDLDDFLDGFAGGLSASIVVHIRNYANANDGWLSIFENLGTALSHALIINRSRRWVGPGVKATLT